MKLWEIDPLANHFIAKSVFFLKPLKSVFILKPLYYNKDKSFI